MKTFYFDFYDESRRRQVSVKVYIHPWRGQYSI
jgi:hypothetical protein